ncbi:MAG: trypsin-like peptidase domain-containing protein [Akkermansiaceae bacterium]|nr:trypsin-like peptidase domain-containing protein [Akkermansiaceae bacterium]
MAAWAQAPDFASGFATTVEKAAPSAVTIATLVPVEGEDLERWKNFESAQKRQLTLANVIIEIDGKPYQYQGHGSGFAIDDQGHIMTNHHVIEAVEMEPKVRFAVTTGTEGAWHAAELVGADPSTDLAVLSCKGSGAVPAVWGDSTKLRAGEFVLAIGTPRDLALRQTVTLGIVSATGRTMGGLAYEDFIQTDASINPGNSGGPLVNARGEVVGVNQSILLGTVQLADGTAAQTAEGVPMRAEGNIGLGLAVPASIARRVAADLLEDGKPSRGFLGVRMEEVEGGEEGLAARVVRVAEVLKEGPAAAAGLKVGDILISLDGAVHATARSIHLAVSMAGPGREVELGLLREGQPMTVKLKLGDLAQTPFASLGFDPEARDFPGIEGVEFRVMQDESGAQRVVITGVAPDSAAAMAGLRAPALVAEVAGVPVESPEAFVAAAESSISSGHILLKVQLLGPRGPGPARELSLKVAE